MIADAGRPWRGARDAKLAAQVALWMEDQLALERDVACCLSHSNCGSPNRSGLSQSRASA